MDGKEINDSTLPGNRVKTGNFLLDVNEALQEAQEIMTDGKPRERHPEHLLEESTTVEVVKAGRHGDPIEIVVTRSTVTSQPNTDDEGDGALSGSDSESFLPSRTKSSSLCHTYTCNGEGSSDEVVSRRTNVHYRRKRGDNWRLDDGVKGEGDSMKGEDDGHFEVEVKAEYGQDDDGEPFVKKSWEATWRVQKFEYLPEWLQDNEYLRHGHRPPLPSFAQCFRSILSIHTETGNIWTHLIGEFPKYRNQSKGCLAFALLAAWFMTRPDTDIRFQEKVVFSFFFAGAIICLGMSFTFHTVSCHSVAVVRIFCKLDYLGISLLIIGSFVPWLYYGFYCRREPKITYIAMVCVLGLGAVIVSLWDKFSESRYRPLRAGVFLSMGCSGVVPTVHFMITDGVQTLFEDAAFHWLLLMAALYILGTLLYATRTPERFFPGKCDILACGLCIMNQIKFLLFQSHQLFHICVVVAAFVHYYGISEMAMHRIRASCPMDSDAVRAFHHIVEGYFPCDLLKTKLHRSHSINISYACLQDLCLMERKKEISSTGQITRVDVKFAYLTNEKCGSVFVPPSSALPRNCLTSDLTLFYKAGDIVHFTAVPQQGKNECQWLATKVTPSGNNDLYQAPCHQISSPQQVVTITLITETYAYAINDELGTVFIPGSAFQQTEVAKLDSHLGVGDSVIVCVRSQAPRCGCNWIAEYASKITTLNAAASSVVNVHGEGNSCNDLVKRGKGVIVWADSMMVCVINDRNEKVMCPILTWAGGNKGKLFAESLIDVVEVGQTVFYEAIFSNIGLRAKWWSTKSPKKKTKINMKLYRDDCLSALCRSDGWTCVFARILSVEPLEVDDGISRLLLSCTADVIGDVQCDDYCYLLLDTTVRPIRCMRVTVVPAEIAPLAEYQLKYVRDLETSSLVSNCN
uniref:DUF7930 domain-containing protein n=1 Tax=Setaria digitata TaxID=48799 RepID=A0A915PFY8_9BILA